MTSTPVPSTPPKEQIRDDVLPPYEAYMRDKGSEWKARAAGNAVAHFGEHVYVYYAHHDSARIHGAGSAEEFIDHLARTNQCVELNIVWDFALAGKHRILTRPPKRPRYISTATTAVNPGIVAAPVRLVPGSTDAFLSIPPNLGGAESPNQEVPLEAGLWMPSCNQWFHEVLKEAVDFWRGWL